MKRYLYLPVLFIMIIQPFIVKAQVFDYPLSVDVNITPPYPVRLSQFTDFDSQVLINVENNSPTESYEINFIGTLTSDNGVNITTRINNLPPCLNRSIMPGLSNPFTGSDLREMFTAPYLTIDPATQQYINENAALPQGSYTFCIRAFACGDPRKALSPPTGMMEGCVTFPIDYVQPPILRYPECDEVLPLTNVTEFRWDPVFSIQPGPILYKLQMVEVLPAGSDPTQAFLNATEPYLVNIDNISPTNYNFDPAMFGVLEGGTQYAYRIVAYQDEAMGSTVVFENGGASVPCKISFGNAVTNFTFEPSFPMDGDYIPYDFFPFIAKFSPYSNNYIRFNGDFTLLEKQGESYQEIASHPSNNAWGDGPARGQSNSSFTVTEDEAQYLPVYKNLTEDPSPSILERGKRYAWEFNGEMQVRRGSPVRDVMDRVEFTVGMSPASHIAPADGSTQEPGMITLRWTSADQPSEVVPFNVTQWGRRTNEAVSSMYPNSIDEHWVLEVSPEADFDSIIHTDENRLNLGLIGEDMRGEIISQLYGNLERAYEFTEDGTYYWRLKWLKTPGDLNSEPYSISPVWSFIIGEPEEPIEEGELPRETPGDCESDCMGTEITNVTAVTITNGSSLRMGKFTIKVTDISSTGANQYSGEGEISIPFLNDVKVKVSFTDIKANSDGRIFIGSAKAKDDLPHISTEDVSTVVNGMPVDIPDFSEAESDALEAVFQTGERLVSLLGSTRAMGMPLGLDTEIDDHRFVLGITQMNFEPLKADMTAVARIDIPALGDKLPAFGARGICITPSGLGGKYALYLARDHEIATAGDFSFVFNGNMEGDTTRASYIDIDCSGFKCARLSGTATIPSDKLIAMNEDKTVNEGEQVKGTFAFKGCSGNNYMGSIEFSAFQVKGMQGWGFKPIIAYLDWSDLENPPGFTFPEGYEFSRAERSVNSWKGFYLKELSLHAPKEFEDDVMGDVTANVQNVIIDDTGFTGSVSVMNLIDYDDGEVEGWAFSLDSIGFGIVQNTSITGGFKGKLGTPIFDEEDYLHYSTALSFVDDTLEYNFRVLVEDTLNMSVWKAKVNLFEDSQILFETGSAVDTKLSMDLTGDMTFEGDLGIPQLSLPGIEFQGLYVSTEPTFRIRYWDFTSPEKSGAGFPLNINDIGFSGGFTNPAVDFDVALTLSNAGFHAEVGLQVIGKIETDADGRIHLAYDTTRLDAITIDQKMDGGIRINGSLEFYEEDLVYGNGMKGDVAVTLPMDMKVSVTVQFGTVRRNETARFNTENYFSYWYVDGSLRIPQNTVTLFPGFELRGFGGGAYHHMQMTTLPDNTIAGPEGGPSESSGAVYAPHFPTVLGLKASITMAMSEPKSFNMDVGVEATFAGYGLASLVLTGDGYVMAGFEEREDAKVTANIEIGYINDGEGGKRVYGDFDVFVNVDPILTGAGADNLFVKAEFLVDNDTWHFYMGKQSEGQRGGLTLNVLEIVRARLETYFMVGHGIPPDLPPLPEEVSSLLYGAQQSRIDGSVDPGTLDREIPSDLNNNYENGKGFAMGAHFYFGADMDFAIFYANLELWLGFDLNISQNEKRVCYETGLAPGVNGWYGKGQMYAALRGELGVQVDLFFIKGRFPIIKLGAAVGLQGGMPKPIWISGRAGLTYDVLNGAVKGYCNFKVEAGQKCTYADPNPFSDIEFISGFEPDGNQDDISVFTAPQVAFSLPVNELLELNANLEDEPEKVRVFYPFIDDITLRDSTNRLDVEGRYILDPSHVSARFEPVGALEEFASHSLIARVKSYEHFPNGTRALVQENDSDWSETKKSIWETGARPDVVDEEQVAYTYPINRQSYFLKNEVLGGKGILKFRGANQNYLFEQTEDADGNRYDYFAKFIKLDDETTSQGGITTGNDHFSFEIPDLENSAIYAVQIIRKTIPPPLSLEEQLRRTLPEGTSSNAIVTTGTLREALSLGRAGTTEIYLTNVKLLPNERVVRNEKMLYSFYFRTSRYNSFSEKLNGVRMVAEYNFYRGSLLENIQLKGRMVEPFDVFEIRGVFKNGTQMLPPLLTFMDLQSNRNYYGPAGGIYTLHREMKRLNGQKVRVSGLDVPYAIFDFADLNSTRRGQGIYNTIPYKTINLGSDTFIGGALADRDLDRAAGINQYVPSTSQSGNPTSTNSNSGLNLTGSIGSSTISTGLISGVNLGTNVISEVRLAIDPNAANKIFHLNFNTSLHVKLDAMYFQRQLSRWMATDLISIMIPGNSIFSSGITNGRLLHFDERKRSLNYHINTFLASPTSVYHYRNGTYNYRIGYKYPGSFVGSNITKSFNINYHDESLY